MKLYYLPGSCSFVPHVALEWINQPYEAKAVTREDLKTTEYLALNPLATVPLLVEGDFVLSQNIAILNYLDHLHPEALLFGSKTLQDKSNAMKWLAFFNADLHKAFVPFFRLPAYAQDNAQLTAEIHKSSTKHVLDLLAIADKHLSTQLFFGKNISVADVYLYVELRWCKFIGLDYSHLTNLEPFYNRVGDHAVIKSVLAQEGLSA